jgi:hypothetical protein
LCGSSIHEATFPSTLDYPDNGTSDGSSGRNQAFVLKTDASDQAIGVELSQDQGDSLHPIAFYSRKLSLAELNYPIHEWEFLALIAAMKHWRHYLKSTINSS